MAAGIPSAVVTPGAFKYKTCEPVGRVMTVERAGIHKLPVSPAASVWASSVLKPQYVLSSTTWIVSAVIVSSYVSSGISNVVVTSEMVTATLVDSDTSINVVSPGKSTAVSTPLTVTWVCWDGMVISVEAAPSKVKNVSTALYDSSRVVAVWVNVVVNGKVVNCALLSPLPSEV